MDRFDVRYSEELDGLGFSDQRKRELVEKASLHGRRSDVVMRSISAFAIVGTLAFSSYAYASGWTEPASVWLADVFGAGLSPTEVVEGIGRPLDATCVSDGVVVRAEAVMGDRYTQTIVLSIGREEGSPLGSIETLDTGLLGLFFEGSQVPYIDGVRSDGGRTYFYDRDPGDNQIQCVIQSNVFLSDAEAPHGRSVRLRLGDLYAHSDGAEDVLIARGRWSLDFELDYEDTSREVVRDARVSLGGAGEISHASACVSYLGAYASFDTNLPWSEARRLPIVVTMADGSTFNVADGQAYTEEFGSVTTVRMSLIFDEAIGSTDVSGVTIGGVPVDVVS